MNLIGKFTEVYEDCMDYYKKIEAEGFDISEEINCMEEGWNNKELYAKLNKAGLLCLTAGPGLRLLPPLTITREEMDKGLAILKETLK